MSCLDPAEVQGYVEGGLDAGEHQQAESHLATCDACRRLVAALAMTTGSTGSEVVHRRMPALGAEIDRYRLVEVLGQGGMGIVYQAHDPQLHRDVAIKVLRADPSDPHSPDLQARLLREAQAMAQVAHPNVIAIYDVGTWQGEVFLAMELATAGTLRVWCRSRAAREIIAAYCEAGRGLAAAHAAGLVHRDFKPDNVLVGADGRVRVTDFGLARSHDMADEPAPGTASARLGTLTAAGAVIGTPGYMAPELVDARPADARTDQFAFCVALWEALYGQRPFAGHTVAELARAAHLGEVVTPPVKRGVSRSIERALRRGLQASPDARWPSMTALVDALALGGRRRARLAAWLGVAAVAIAAATWVVLPARRSDPAAQSIHLADSRPGCNCPLSACTRGSCASVCRAGDFTIGAPIPGVSVRGRQEALLGVSGDGDSILYLAGRRCALDRLMLARRRGDSYESVDLTDKLDRRRVAIFEGCCTFAANGASMIIARPDRRGFVRVRLSGNDVLPLDDHDELGELVADATAMPVQFPVLSADELTLYYRAPDERADVRGPLYAVTFASHRADVHSPFPPGERLPGRARYYDYVSGVSSDHLSLFMEGEYRTHVLVRSSVDEPFADPSPELGMLPTLMPGWRSVPTADCRRIATTWTPGGCESEDIVWLEAKSP